MDPIATYNPIFEDEFYFDGQHNGGNLNPYIYCYQNPIKYVDPNGGQKLIIKWLWRILFKSRKIHFWTRII